MPSQPILLYRRRWTLIFQVPFVLLMAACLAFSLFLALASGSRLLAALGWVGAFVSFCVGGTLGNAAWKAYRWRDPAMVIDADGITDLQGDEPRTVPWSAMDRVHLDNYESVILVRLRQGTKTSFVGAAVQALQRWQRRGDVAFHLGGLAYDTRQVQVALKEFLAASRQV